MKKGDEASPSIILANLALLVKMLILLEARGAFDSNFVYLCILTLSSHWYAKWLRSFTEHHFGRSSPFRKNAHNSWTAWYIHFKFCIPMYFNIAQPLVCKTVTRLHRASFWPVVFFLMKMLITLELRGIFCLNFAYYCIWTLFNN